MKAFYELYRDTENEIIISKRSDYSFPPHFHASIEIFILLSGKYDVTVDDKSYKTDEKSIILADSFTIHSYTKTTADPADTMLMLIPSVYLSEFNAYKNGKSLKSAMVTDKQIVDEVLVLADFVKRHESLALKQEYVNVILLLLTEHLGLIDAPQQKNTATIREVLSYIDKNFRNNITLESISRHFGYSDSHLSRIFHSYFSMSISRYINNLRIQYVESNKSSGVKLLPLIYDAGFSSPQTYYRNLKYYKNKNIKHIKD